MKSIKYFNAILLIVVATSCEDFLTEKPTSFINPNTFFRTEADAQAAVVAGYDFYGGFNSVTFGWHRDFIYEAMSDDFFVRKLGTVNGTLEQSFYRNLNSANANTGDAYNTHFQGINTYSVAIDGISSMPAFNNQKALIAEAKYLRAYTYFILVRLYGRVPLIEKSLEASQVRSLPRASSVDEVYALIISDLQSAVNDGWKTAPAPGRVTKWAAMSLLAKVHLTRQNWQAAAQLAERVINESPHKLLPVFADVFRDDNENNAESIFEIQMEVGAERSNQVGNWPRGIGPAGNRDFFLGPNWGGLYVVNDDLLNSFEVGDVRRKLISTTVTRKDGTVIEFNADGDTPNYSLKRTPTKYIEGIESNNNSSYNFIAIRLAEVYLIAAEAENEANGPGNAYKFINPVRARAGLAPLSGLNKDSFRTAVRNERRHELYDERSRYFDLLRWGNLVERIKLVRPAAQIQDFNQLWPIPQSAIDRNPALIGNQNPGYN